MKQTSLRISIETKDLLDKFKIHPRQSYDEVLRILINHCKEAEKEGDFEIFKKSKR